MFGIPVTYIPWDGEPEVVLDGTETAVEASVKVTKKLDELKTKQDPSGDVAAFRQGNGIPG